MRVLLTIFLLSSLLTDLPAQTITFSTSCEMAVICSNENDCGPSLVDLSAMASTTCNTGGLTINYTIDLYDDGSIDESNTGNSINDSYPLGSHRIILVATDDCSNEETCEFLFLIEDCTAPIAATFNGIAGEANPDQDLVLNASDLNLGSTDNCGISSILLVSPSQGPGQTMPPMEATSSISFSCDDLGVNTFDFWVGDSAGNWDYKSTYALVENNLSPFCSGGNPVVNICLSSIAECGQPIGGVSYIGISSLPGIPNIDFSVLPCQSFPSGSSISSIIPEKDINHLNGVSTFDLVLISKHILDIQLLDSPYKIISADANHSGSVSTIDLVEIRKLILGIIPAYTNNTSWRFVDSSFVFPNPQDPFQTSVPEICIISGEDVMKTFIGMKIGDVNKSAAPGDSLSSSEIEDRSILNLDLLNQHFEAGENISIDFFAGDINKYTGFQFELGFDMDFLNFDFFERGILKDFNESNFNIQNDQGKISISWINMDTDPIEQTSSPLFTFKFNTKKSGMLKDLIKLSKTRLSPEAYTNDLAISNLNINYLEEIQNSALIVKNTPNPFQDETRLTFDLPESDQITLTILDAKGTIIKSIQKTVEKGRNEIRLKGDLFPTDGIYFYHLESSLGKRIGKFLKL